MELAKLDSYDYQILPGLIRIFVDGVNDPDLVDIMSEIQNSGGSIYIDGIYYIYLDNYCIIDTPEASYLDLFVVENHNL